MRLTTAGKVAVLIVVIGAAIGAWRLWRGPAAAMMAKIAPEAKTKEAAVPQKADLPAVTVASSGGAGANVAMPGTGAGCADRPEVRLLGYAWNAQMGLMFANGGPQATSGSLMCKHGVNLKFMRQDDNGKMQENLVAFATQLQQGNPNPDKGAHFVTIMGDGSATFLKGLNDALKRLGPEYTAKVVGSCGFSRGEDKFMGPPEWKANPVASRGGLVAGVLRDGDWNIAQKWWGAKGPPTNRVEKLKDPNALTGVNAPSNT